MNEPGLTASVPSAPSTYEQITAAVAALREDAGDDAALGDAASQTRNIAVGEAALTLQGFIKANRENTKLVVDAGGVEALILALQRRPNSEAVQSKATSALASLVASTPGIRTLVGEKGGVEVVVSALRGHPASESVQESAVEALVCLIASDNANRAFVRRARGVEAVIIAQEQHATNAALQKNGCFALGLLVLDSYEDQMQAGRAQGVNALVRAMREHQSSEVVQGNAVEALGHLVAQNRENQALARDAGAISLTVDVLRRYPDCKGVQLKALRTIRDVVAGNCRNQAIAAQAEVMSAVLSALEIAQYDEVLKELACDAVEHLVVNSPANQTLARDVGLIEAVIRKVLAKHPANAALQARALSVLGALVADNPESQKLAVEADGLDVVTAALRKHLESEAVMECAAEALGHLVAGSRDSQVLAGRAGAVEATVAVLGQHPASPVLQPKTLYALRTLVLGNHCNTMQAVSAGGTGDVLNALKQRPKGKTELDVSDDSSPEQRCQRLAREAGMIEAVVSALKESQHKWTSKACLLNALAEAVMGNYENQKLAAEAGGIDAVVSALKGSVSAESIQETASRALSGLLAENAINQRLAKDANADDALLYAQNVHSESPQVREALHEAMEALCSGESFPYRIMDTEYGKRHQTYCPITDTAMRGVTLEQILELADFIQETLLKHDLEDASDSLDGSTRGQSISWDEMTMYQVRDYFMTPLTTTSKCSFVEVVAQGKQQPPMWMVSHWWGTPFNFTVRMLEMQARSRHLHAAAAVAYWCDAFANNPHGEFSGLDEGDVLKSPFARAMMSPGCMGTVLLCDPNVTPLLRTWCVFEAHITQQLRCGALGDRTDRKRYFLDILATSMHHSESKDPEKVTITMLQDAVGGSWNEVSETEGVFFPLDIAHVGVGVDVRKAETSLESDRASILNYLTEGVASNAPPAEDHAKYEEMNAFVHEVFVSAELYRVATEQQEACVEEATHLLQMRADVNSFLRQGNTALFAAAGADPTSSGTAANTTAQHDLMKVLLKARAEVNHANAEMKTVLDCATSLSSDSRDLLLEHGAKTYADAAPELERSANTRLTQILSTGFGSERQAFVGGDAGTRLTQAAHRSLQVAASSVLKLYHWAPCRIGVQTGNGRHQAQLADERADSVRLALESAGCRNQFEVRFGAQKVLLSLSVSLAPPSWSPASGAHSQLLPATVPPTPLSAIGSRDWERRAFGAANLDLVVGSPLGAMHPRSPQAVLGLRSAPSKLPPMAATPVRTPGLGGTVPTPAQEGSVPGTSSSMRGGRRARLGPPHPPAIGGIKPCPVPVELDSAAPKSASVPSPLHDARPTTSQGPRQVGLPGMRHMPLSQMTPAGGGPSWVARTSSMPQTPPNGSSPAPRGAKDLDTIAGAAGDRWFQTSITCSWSSPALHSQSGQPAEAPRTAPRSPHSPQGSSGPWAKPNKAAAEHEAGWQEANCADGRPPTRGGARRNNCSRVQVASGQAMADMALESESMRRHSLPTLNASSSPQRPQTHVFTVSDLANA